MGGRYEPGHARCGTATSGLTPVLTRAFTAVATASVLAGACTVVATRAESLPATVASVLLAVAFIVVGAGAARRSVRAVTHPVWLLQRTMDRLARGDASARTQPTGPAELRGLAESCNDVAVEAESLSTAQTFRLLDERTLGDIRRRIHASLEVEALLPDALAALAPMLDADRIAVWLDGNDGELHPVATWHARDVPEVLGARPTGVSARLRLVKQILARETWPLVVDDTTRADVADDPTAVAYAAVGVRAVVVSPLGGNADGSRGVLSVHLVKGPRRWSQHELALVDAVAKEIGTAVSHANAYMLERETVRRLESLDAEKSAFVSSVSHELRTPLTSILGYLEMLQDGDAGPLTLDQKVMFETIDRNGKRLLALIDDLLALSRLESGAVPTIAAEVPVASVVAHAIDALGFAACRQQLELTGTVSEDVGCVRGDADQLERVLLNLVGNAVKFTPAGGRVDVEAYRHAGGVRISVSDTGIGIPTDEHHRLFTQFYRSSNARSGAIAGTGLGLSIVKKLIEAHGGRVTVASVPDLGTTVTIELPDSEPSATDSDGADPERETCDNY